MPSWSRIDLPPQWVDWRKLDEVLASQDPHREDVGQVLFQVPEGSKIMVDAAVRLLSLANQLDLAGKKVAMNFEEGASGTMGYLNRIGVFDRLRSGVAVLPDRPAISSADMYHGMSERLVEIESISPSAAPKDLPGRLADALSSNSSIGAQERGLNAAAFTVFAELIQNIHRHSSTKVDGYAALQVYQQGGRAKVVVSDSGRGILATLRPALKTFKPALAALADTELVVETFKQGLSRHRGMGGCGLKASAEAALRFRADLNVRLHNSRVHLEPSPGGYRPNIAWCTEGLATLWGTHLCFDFRLDS